MLLKLEPWWRLEGFEEERAEEVHCNTNGHVRDTCLKVHFSLKKIRKEHIIKTN